MKIGTTSTKKEVHVADLRSAREFHLAVLNVKLPITRPILICEPETVKKGVITAYF